MVCRTQKCWTSVITGLRTEVGGHFRHHAAPRSGCGLGGIKNNTPAGHDTKTTRHDNLVLVLRPANVVSPLIYVGSHPTIYQEVPQPQGDDRPDQHVGSRPTMQSFRRVPCQSPGIGGPRLTHGVLGQANQEASRSTQAPGYSGMPSMKTTPNGKEICHPS